MDFQVSARKWRPQKFSELIGQEHIVRTLSNAIELERVPHAFLFSGTRGVGKTTTARILARVLNCEKGPAIDPCGICTFCTEITDGNCIDVQEIDGASNNGVQEVRDLIDSVQYATSAARYKVYIIDEVHMLSKSAFNALLKTLEEPPEHVKFIFATTEVKKIPITIISRCQRFDLHRINNDKLISYLLSVIEKEQIKASDQAIALIARTADGSMRDALSLLDQAISIQNNNITDELIINMLGLADRNNIFELMETIFQGDAPKALETYNNIHNSGADVVMIFDEMLNVTHFITQMKLAPELKNDIHVPELERKRAFEISQKISMPSLGIIWQVLFKGFEELQSGFHLFQHGEMIIIRLIYLHNGPGPEDLINKYKNENLNEKKLIKDSPINEEQITNKPATNKISTVTTELKINESTEYNKKTNPGNLSINSFRQFVDLFYQKREAMLHTLLYNNVKIVSFTEGEVVINTASITDANFNRTIAKLISTWTGRIWQISSSSSNIGKTLYEEDLIQQQKEIEKMQNDKEIKAILEKFEGVSIHSITNINETTEVKNTSTKQKQKKEN
mgnify:CR=1 FL=1